MLGLILHRGKYPHQLHHLLCIRRLQEPLLQVLPFFPSILLVTALPQAIDHLHELHQLPVLDVFFCLLRLSERVYKGHTAFISSSSSFSFLMLDFLVDSYIVVWISVCLLLSEPCDIKSSIISYSLFFCPWLMFDLLDYLCTWGRPLWLNWTDWLADCLYWMIWPMSWLLWLNWSIRLTVW